MTMAKDIDYGPAFDVAHKMMMEGIDPPSLQEQLKQFYYRVISELEPLHLFDDDFQNAFQALSEAIEYHGGGEHIDYLEL